MLSQCCSLSFVRSNCVKGLKGGVPPEGGMGGGMEGKPGGASFHFTSSDPNEIFKQFFGAGSPFDIGGSSGFQFSGFDGFDSPYSSPSHSRSNSPSRENPVVESKYYVSLEDIYKGAHKKFNVERRMPNGNTESKLFEFDVLPGWKKGTKVTFESDGGAPAGYPSGVQADLVFIMDEKPHPKFTRDGNDLKMKHQITLTEALLGTQVMIETLDARMIPIDVPPCSQPGKKLRVVGEGMPIRKKGAPADKGNLLIEFNVKFPSSLTPQQQQLVRQLSL